MMRLLIILTFLTTSAIAQPFEEGDTLPDIVSQSIYGKTIRLSSLRGQVVLVDFWASWCKPCRKENPEIVKMYLEYKDEQFKNGKGFTVFGVSLDSKKEAWEKAIKKDSLIYPYHVSDLKGWKNEAAVLYGIKAIPQSYLIDGEGKVIAVNPRGGKLEKELKKFKMSEFFKLFYGD